MVLVDVFKSEPDVQRLKANGDMRGLVKAMYYKGDSSVRMAAVLAIKEIGGATAIDHLADALENDDTRWLAASALERIGQPAEKALKEVTNGKNIYAQKMAQRILDKIGYRPDTVLSAATSQTDF